MTHEPTAGRYGVPGAGIDEPHDRYLPEDLSIEDPGGGDGAAGSYPDSGKHAADVARDEAGNVAQEAKGQAKDMLHQARGEVRDQAGSQQQRAVSGLHAFSKELDSMAERSQQQGMASELARQAAQRTHDTAAWLERRDPDEMLDDVRAFARRRPGAFLGIALAAGVVAGRLTRGMTASSDAADVRRRRVP